MIVVGLFINNSKIYSENKTFEENWSKSSKNGKVGENAAAQCEDDFERALELIEGKAV